ncbi:MAG: hypothetical protein JXA18_09220 [Chitinispirillaceae bacterium]|nr:hypothetical protein [Chitinispirillaceae bacterium]
MSAAVLKKNHHEPPGEQTWYSGITPETTPPEKELNVQVVDKGNSMEFILPRKTAQFTEMLVLDPGGKPVWKTQSFNKNIIVWHKQSTFGRRVPKGKYTFRLKQGNRQMNGFALVA